LKNPNRKAADQNQQTAAEKAAFDAAYV